MEKGLSQPCACVKACVVVADFPQIGEASFGNNGLDARFDRPRLQRNRPAHRNAQGVEATNFLAGIQRIHDGNGIVAFLPTVSGHVAAAFPVVARIHRHDAVSMAQQKFGMPDHSCPVVRDAMIKKHPITIRRRRADFPTSQRAVVRSLHREI